MRQMEHPETYRIRKTGYAEKEPSIYGQDYKGHEVYVDDEIYVYNEEFWLAEALSSDEKELLEFFGAKKICATNTDL